MLGAGATLFDVEPFLQWPSASVNLCDAFMEPLLVLPCKLMSAFLALELVQRGQVGQ